jgi:hypothetical protein
MQAPLVYTIDEKRVEELLKDSDPYLKNYVRALKDVSAGWERLYYKAMKKIREQVESKKLIDNVIGEVEPMKTLVCSACKDYKCILKTSLPIYPDCPGSLGSIGEWKDVSSVKAL